MEFDIPIFQILILLCFGNPDMNVSKLVLLTSWADWKFRNRWNFLLLAQKVLK